MKEITIDMIKKFGEYLINEEKSSATCEKYIRDVKAFGKWLGSKVVEKTVVMEYKKLLADKYSPISANSMISSVNKFFDFLGWHELRVKAFKIQRQIFCNKNKELSKYEYERLLTQARKNKNEKIVYVNADNMFYRYQSF